MKKLTGPKIIRQKISSRTDVIEAAMIGTATIEITIENSNFVNHHLGHLYRIDHVHSTLTPRITVGRRNVSCVIKKDVDLAIILTRRKMRLISNSRMISSNGTIADLINT